ncbi:unnamed protein product [Vicia faba]|uniref:Uncharacterized protein n=1 Tax=Vicia faba TaxID=3906 RepID=A0AAV1A509_VICFA|nr:unnamed protein product [Vicia faba]
MDNILWMQPLEGNQVVILELFHVGIVVSLGEIIKSLAPNRHRGHITSSLNSEGSSDENTSSKVLNPYCSPVHHSRRRSLEKPPKLKGYNETDDLYEHVEHVDNKIYDYHTKWVVKFMHLVMRLMGSMMTWFKM